MVFASIESCAARVARVVGMSMVALCISLGEVGLGRAGAGGRPYGSLLC